MTRDLLGYGGVSPDFTWPNGSRLAVSVAINFEEGAERQVGDGDETSETVGEVLSVVGPGVRDFGQEQIFAYGMRAGFWRMIDALDEFAVPATFFFCGRAVERSPLLARTAVERGHEAAVHGWRWRPHSDYASREEEARDLDRCIAALKDHCGVAPKGFFCRGSESVWTRELLLQRGFAYTSNALDDDLPYWSREAAPGLVVVPYALDTNDMKFFHPNGFVNAADMVTYVQDAFETLIREAQRQQTRLLNIGFHLRIAGRPARFQAFLGILSFLAARRDDIYLATRLDIANAFAEAVPFGDRPDR